jgi:hypothetical protein
MTTTTTHKFKIDDIVNLRGPDGVDVDYGTVVRVGITPAEYERTRAWYGDVEGDGPVYLVNVGNVHSDTYEYLYAESELSLGQRGAEVPCGDPNCQTGYVSHDALSCDEPYCRVCPASSTIPRGGVPGATVPF